MLSKHEQKSEASKAEYRVTSKGMFSTEWTVTSDQEPNKYLKFPCFGPCMLLDNDMNPVGKISSEKFWTTKKLIQLNTNSCQLRVQWHPKVSKFLLTGQTDIKGFEEIKWKWKIKGWNSKFILKVQNDKDDEKEKKKKNKEKKEEDIEKEEGVIAEFRRSSWKIKEVGFLYIFEDLPPDINLFIIYSICFCINHIEEEESAAAAAANGG
jgi:hypothetical protein